MVIFTMSKETTEKGGVPPANVIPTRKSTIEQSAQERITPPSLEKSFGGVPVQCAPFGEGIINGSPAKWENRIKIGSGFKVIAVLKSRQQVRAILKASRDPDFQLWMKKYLPETIQESSNEVSDIPDPI